MELAKSVYAPNGIVFLHGRDDPAWPDPIWGAQINYTSEAVIVGCTHEQEGPTEIVLTDRADALEGVGVAYEGRLLVKGGIVQVTDVAGETLLSMSASERSIVRVWQNNPRWPDRVTIGVLPESAWTIAPEPFPSRLATVGLLPPSQPIDGLFLMDGRLPMGQRDFNPWDHSTDQLSGVSLDLHETPFLIVSASDPDAGLSEGPQVDTVIDTPSGEIQIFDRPRGRAALKVSVSHAQTRARIWIERFNAKAQVRIALTAIDGL